jgi:hypothetical protein
MSRFAVVYEDPEYDTELPIDDSDWEYDVAEKQQSQGGFVDVSGWTAAEIKYMLNSD